MELKEDGEILQGEASEVSRDLIPCVEFELHPKNSGKLWMVLKQRSNYLICFQKFT